MPSNPDLHLLLSEGSSVSPMIVQRSSPPRAMHKVTFTSYGNIGTPSPKVTLPNYPSMHHFQKIMFPKEVKTGCHVLQPGVCYRVLQDQVFGQIAGEHEGELSGRVLRFCYSPRWEQTKSNAFGISSVSYYFGECKK